MSSRQLPSHNKKTLPPQEVIDLFKRTFDNELYNKEEDPDLEILQSHIQAVKTDLYNRDYHLAFDDDDKRVGYCCRWSPSRAISYGSLLASFDDISDILTCEEGEDQNVLCVGGGAGAELMAIASIFTPSREFMSKYAAKKSPNQVDAPKKASLNLKLVDIADWTNVTNRLLDQIKTNWLYDNEIDNFVVDFQNDDVLKMSNAKLNLPSINLITLLFTTNELFKQQKSESIRFFQKLNKTCSSGCLMLIVESAGSYSHITVGTKKFPLQFLIDTILCGQRGHEDDGAWEIIDQNDSIWYRCSGELDYRIKLENMRFFYRLYRKK